MLVLLLAADYYYNNESAPEKGRERASEEYEG